MAYVEEALPGILVGSFMRFKEIGKCLFSDCESWVLKVEKVLIHFAYVFGFTTPSRLIWKVLKSLLQATSTQLKVYLENHPETEYYVRMGISTVEQAGLAHVWDTVRDGSICMRFNNCENDFLIQLCNIKIKYCEVENPNDDRRKPSVCEKVFNDSPLIILAVVMLILAIVANTQWGGEAVAENSEIEPEPLEPSKNKETIENPPAEPSTPVSTPPPPDSPPPPETRSPTTSNGKEQVIHAQCPKCSKQFVCTIPKPWVLYCSRSLLLVKKCKGTGNRSTRNDTVTRDAVKKMLKEIKCDYCRNKIKKCLKDIQAKKRKSTLRPRSSSKK